MGSLLVLDQILRNDLPGSRAGLGFPKPARDPGHFQAKAGLVMVIYRHCFHKDAICFVLVPHFFFKL